MPATSKPLTATAHALLGLLALRPWTTYELAKQVQRSLGWFWPRTERKLYDEPKKLVAAGLATATEQHTGKRARTVYAITPEGRAALRAWLDEPSAAPALEFEAMVKVFFADGGALAQLRTTLDRTRKASEARLAVLEQMVEEDQSEHYEFAGRLAINALALRFHLDHERHIISWATWARAQVETWHSPTDAAGWDWSAALQAPR